MHLIFILFFFFSSFVTPAHAGALNDLVNSPKVKPVIHHNVKNNPANPQQYTMNLAIVAIFQNEADYMKEWIEYHLLIGVEHFYLYNNLSTDTYLDVLQPYIDRQIVDLIDWPYEAQNLTDYNDIQIRAYQDCWVKVNNGQLKWLAIIDFDEFLVPIQDNDLPTFLKRFESDAHIGGVCGAWVFFGTSHVEHIPSNQLMIETLVLNGGGASNFFPWANGAYKSIVRPDYVAGVVSPHFVFYKQGYSHIGLNYDLIQINHYWTRDEFYLNTVKIPRRIAWGWPPEVTLSVANSANKETPFGLPILRFVPALRQRMGLQ